MANTRTELTCASCGRPAHVPFKPRKGRPIYCRECHRARQAGHPIQDRAQDNGHDDGDDFDEVAPLPPPPLPRRGFGRAGVYD